MPVTAIGFAVGLLGALVGVGGGFMMIPALIYLMRVPTTVAIGTSLLLVLITNLFATVMHAVENRTVDVVLALTLMIGGVIGAQFGARAGQAMRAEQLRLLLALLVLAVGARVAVDLLTPPADVFSVIATEALE
jgi:uncharacterized membrane protein YfcA